MNKVRISLPRPCSVDWGALTPDGKDRHCAVCTTTVVDVETRSEEELEAILRSPGRHCVRVRISKHGEIKLAPNASGLARRFVASVGIGAVLLAGSPPLAARESKATEGTIAGQVENSDWQTRAVATSADGKSYTAKIKSSGKFKVKHLPPGTYQLSFTAACSEPWQSDPVVVEAGKTTQVTIIEQNDCIIVGVVEIIDDHG